MKLCGKNGVVTYTNTLPGIIDHTNTATWIANTKLEKEYAYRCLVNLYGEPSEIGGAYWSWQSEEVGYNIILQHGDLGIKIIIQKRKEWN